MNTDTIWQSPQHWVIAAPLDFAQGQTMTFIQTLLSEEEQLRMQRFRHSGDQQRYALAHGLKRFGLSKMLGVEPRSLLFKAGDKGKPYCEHAGAPQFNISHSGDWVLLGVSSIADIGVDVERVSREVSESVTRYALTEAQLESVSKDSNPPERFMIYWTQKEAISKALGLGLSIDFKTVNCSGEMQESRMTYSDKSLTVNTCLLDEHIVSVATTVTEQPAMYRLSAWQDAQWQLQCFPNVVEKT